MHSCHFVGNTLYAAKSCLCIRLFDESTKQIVTVTEICEFPKTG